MSAAESYVLRVRPLMFRVALLLLAGVLVPVGSAVAVDPAVVAVQSGRSFVRIATEDARVQVRIRRFRLKVWRLAPRRAILREDRGGGLFYERGGGTHELGRVTNVEPLADGARLTVDTEEGQPATVTLRFLTSRTLEIDLVPPRPDTVTAAGERLRSPRKERIYGLTERLRDSPSLAPPVLEIPIDDARPPEVGSLDRRGETVEMRILPTFSLYAPFYHSSLGYGLSVDGTTFGLFDLASTAPKTVSFRFELGTTVESRRLRFYVYAGPEHTTILDEYTNLTGRPFVPPDWAFLNWRWRGELDPGVGELLDGVLVNADLADDINNFDTHAIPTGVYIFDRPALVGNFGFAQWEWDSARFPNLASMLASVSARGYRLGTWSSTWMCGDGPDDIGTVADALGYLAPSDPGPTICSNGGGNFIMDVTNPAARDWWRDEITAFIAPYDVRVIKLDRGEEHIPSEADDIWFDGRTGREVRNDYPVLQTKIHHDALQAAFPDGEFLVFTRSGYTGTQQWAVAWGGDTAGAETFGLGPGTDLGLRSAIISQQRAAFMGYPIWGSDTGGYYQFKDREVFARWIEFSAFSGLMEIGGVGAHAPWDMPTVPGFDLEMIEIYQRYTMLRETLLPYISAAADDAATGVPIVRPMPFFDRDDRELADRWDQYMFGPDLMVAPVWRSGDRSREVYFPRGVWRSYWDPAQSFTGRTTLTVEVPLDVIPVYVREGATVPGP